QRQSVPARSACRECTGAYGSPRGQSECVARLQLVIDRFDNAIRHPNTRLDHRRLASEYPRKARTTDGIAAAAVLRQSELTNARQIDRQPSFHRARLHPVSRATVTARFQES